MDGITVPAELAAYIPLITVLLQVLKQVPKLAKMVAWFPVLSVGMGVLIAFITMGDVELAIKIVGGVVLGVAASGLYSGAKALGSLNKAA